MGGAFVAVKGRGKNEKGKGVLHHQVKGKGKTKGIGKPKGQTPGIGCRGGLIGIGVGSQSSSDEDPSSDDVVDPSAGRSSSLSNDGPTSEDIAAAAAEADMGDRGRRPSPSMGQSLAEDLDDHP